MNARYERGRSYARSTTCAALMVAVYLFVTITPTWGDDPLIGKCEIISSNWRPTFRHCPVIFDAAQQSFTQVENTIYDFDLEAYRNTTFNSTVMAFWTGFCYRPIFDSTTYVITQQMEWCVDVFSPQTCLYERPTMWHLPEYIYGMWPPLDNSKYYAITNLSTRYGDDFEAWDSGGQIGGSVTMLLDSACQEHPNDFGKRGAHTQILAHAINGSFFLEDMPNVSQPAEAFAVEALNINGNGTEDFKIIPPVPLNCSAFGFVCPNATTDRYKEVRTYPSSVTMECLDEEFGYVWRVENLDAPHLWYFWEIYRPGTNEPIIPFGRAVGLYKDCNNTNSTGGGGNSTGGNSTGNCTEALTDAPEVYLPSNETIEERNLLYDWRYNGMEKNQTGRHGGYARHHFYIPSWFDKDDVPSGNATNSTDWLVNATLPSLLNLYAGRPDHYRETTTNAAVVRFLPISEMFHLDLLAENDAAPFNETIIRAKSAFEGDYERQALHTICEDPIVRMHFMVQALQTNWSSYNLTVPMPQYNNWLAFCELVVLDEDATWPDALAVAKQFFLAYLPPPLNDTSIEYDPMPRCRCDMAEGACGEPPEGENMTAANQTFRMSYDYLRVQDTTVNVTTTPVCRMPLEGSSEMMGGSSGHIYPTNLPPLNETVSYSSPIVNEMIFTLETRLHEWQWPHPRSSWRNMSLDEDRMYDGGDNVSYVNYTRSPMGIVWSLRSENLDPRAVPVTAMIEVANWNLTDDSAIDIPYPYIKRNYFRIQPNQTYWLLSRTRDSQRIYGTLNWPCDSGVDNCTDAIPQYPLPDDPDTPEYGLNMHGYGTVNELLNESAANALPLCECRVNMPCDFGEFIHTTNNNETLGDLPSYAADNSTDPIIPTNFTNLTGICVPTYEVCNCFDDDCDGVIDNIDEATCGSDVGECRSGKLACPESLDCPQVPAPEIHNMTYGANATKPAVAPYCKGATFPQPERCDPTKDYDCDGIKGNHPLQGTVCSSNVGICKEGIYKCIGGALVCDGGILPDAQETCDNGLDDDCNGLIDDGHCLYRPENPANGDLMPSHPPYIPTVALPPPSPPPPPPTPSPPGHQSALLPPFIFNPSHHWLFFVLLSLVVLAFLLYCLVMRRANRQVFSRYNLKHPFSPDSEQAIFYRPHATYTDDNMAINRRLLVTDDGASEGV